MSTTVKVIIGVVAVGAIVGGVMYWRKRKAGAGQVRPPTLEQARAGANQRPAMVMMTGVKGAASPTVHKKRSWGSRFAHLGQSALHTGLKVGAVAGVPGAAQAQFATQTLGV